MQENITLLQRLFSHGERAARENKIPLASGLIFGLAAHMFAFSNKLVNADEVESLFGKGATVTSGRWGLEAVKLIFPDYSMPWLWGMLSLMLLAVSACLMIRLLEIKSPIMQAVLSGMVTAFPSQTGVFCFMFTSSAYALAFLLSVVSVWLTEKGTWRGFAFAAVSLCLSLGIYQAYVAVSASLFVLVLIRRCLDCERPWYKNVLRSFRAFAMMLAALGLYALVNWLVFRFGGVQFNDYVRDNVNEASISGRIRMAYDFFCYTLSYREFALISGEVSRWMHIVCLALCIVLLVFRAFGLCRSGEYMNAAVLLSAAFLLPLAVYCMFLVMDKGSIHTLVLHSFVAFYFLAALLADRLLCSASLPSRGGRDLLYVALSIALMSNIYLANKCYVKQYLLYENAYSFYSILLSRAQGTEGYTVGDKLAVIGHQNNKITKFAEIDLGYLMGPGQDLINIYSRENFLRRYMGTDIPLADKDEIEYIQSLEEFEQMSEYPYYDSVRKIDSYIVVKLG